MVQKALPAVAFIAIFFMLLNLVNDEPKEIRPELHKVVLIDKHNIRHDKQGYMVDGIIEISLEDEKHE